MSNYLVISDLQIPFENSNALEFCKYLQRHYKIPKQNIICVGDETDNYFGGMYKRDINNRIDATGEYEQGLEKLQQWYKAFPIMRLCRSNHADRWIRKATECEIPKFILKRYEELIKAPEQWIWLDSVVITETKSPFLVEHGDMWSGQKPHVDAAKEYGMSVALGHHHTKSCVELISSKRLSIWAAMTGCLIDPQSFAFHYAAKQRNRPALSTLVVLDSGRLPLLHSLNQFEKITNV